MPRSEWYRRAEKALYSYEQNEEKLIQLKHELECLEAHGDISVQSYGGIRTSGGVQDKVSDYVHMKGGLEKKIARLEVMARAVRILRKEIEMMNDRDFAEKASAVLEFFYIGKSLDDVRLSPLGNTELEGIRYWLVRKTDRNMYKLKKALKVL